MRTVAGPGGPWFGAKAAPLPRPWSSACGLGWPLCGGVECAAEDDGAADSGALALALLGSREE